MGKLTINGCAKGEYSYDLLDVSITFCGKGTTSSEALNNLLKQCERFLAIMTENGISIESVRMDEDSINRARSYGDDDIDRYDAHRRIVIRIPFQMDVVNMFLSVIEKENFSAEMNQAPILSNEEEIKKELVKKAIGDANEKANAYLEGLNQKIIEVESISTGNHYIRIGSEVFNAIGDHVFKGCALPSLMLNSKLQSPIKELTENVEIVYLIE